MPRVLAMLVLTASVLGSSLAWAWDLHVPAPGGESAWVAVESAGAGVAADACHFCVCGAGHLVALGHEPMSAPAGRPAASWPPVALLPPSRSLPPPVRPPRA